MRALNRFASSCFFWLRSSAKDTIQCLITFRIHCLRLGSVNWRCRLAPLFCVVGELGLINALFMYYKICRFRVHDPVASGNYFQGKCIHPNQKDRISRAWPAKLNQTLLKHQMFHALIFLMRNGSRRSVLVLRKISYGSEQRFSSFRYVSGSEDGWGWDPAN